MNFDIKATENFGKRLKAPAKRYKSIKQDFTELTDTLKDNPYQGVEIIPGVRKIRMAIKSKGKGKSAGAQVITYTIDTSNDGGVIYLLEIYDKSDFSTIEYSVILDMIKDCDVGSDS